MSLLLRHLRDGRPIDFSPTKYLGQRMVGRHLANPCRRIWTESTHMIAYLFGCPRKVNHTRILKDFGCGAQFYQIVLRNGSYRHSLIVRLDDSIHSASNQVRPHHHESVVDRTHVLIICNSDTLLQNDIARINLVLEHEGGSTCFAVAVHNSPVDRRSTTILRQERGMEIKRTQTRHTPHHLGQHTECHNNLQISIVGLKFRKKVFIL